MSRYFSNGTEGYAWMANWCDRCDKDHQAHVGEHENGCEIIARSMLAEPDELIPEWVETWDGTGPFPPGDNVHCLAFAPCQGCNPGDDGCGWETPTGPPPVHKDQGKLFDAPEEAFVLAPELAELS